MKKYSVLFFCAVLLFASQSAFAKQSLKAGDVLYVSVKEGKLTGGEGNFSKTVGTVKYGDRVRVLTVGEKKLEVVLYNNDKFSGQEKISGWISAGSLTKKKIVRNDDGTVTRATADEIALAGKGFSASDESAFKPSEKTADYDEVDSLEKISVSDDELKSFIKNGRLFGVEE